MYFAIKTDHVEAKFCDHEISENSGFRFVLSHLVTCILITYLHFTETGFGIDIGSRIIKAELDSANGIELVIDGKRVSVV